MSKKLKKIEELDKEKRAITKKIKELKDEVALEVGNYVLKITKCKDLEEFKSLYQIVERKDVFIKASEIKETPISETLKSLLDDEDFFNSDELNDL